MGNNSFIGDNFLLQNSYAEELYHTYAKSQPIIDYHNHLSPRQIAENTIFENITQVWINGDHYKWRAMRTMGISEHLITGASSDKDKFMAWAKTVPHTLRNPLYHWTHLELLRYFGIDTILNENTAEEIYTATAQKLNTADYSCRKLIEGQNVEVLCTTEDPTDGLKYHQSLAQSKFATKMSTAFRPDKSLQIENEEYQSYLQQLEEATGISITSFKDLCDALENRIAFFHDQGCRLSDHGLDQMPFTLLPSMEVSEIFEKKLDSKPLHIEEIQGFKTALLLFLCEIYHSKNWVQQFHLGALRNNNSRMYRTLGPDTGWDSIGDRQQAYTLSRFLNALDTKNVLSKTILYNLNPADNEVIASMTGNFNDGSVRGKIQFGSGWWFLDQKNGMTKQLNALSNIGLLSCFVGMLTDSRSFLSFPRHEYFRRILCNILGEEVKNGELPNDMDLLGNLVTNICYSNAKSYFEF